MASKYPCPGCGFQVLSEPPGGTFAICPVCRWEDCSAQFEDPYYDGGPNGISLADHQTHVLQRLPLTVREHDGYRREPQWQPLVAAQPCVLTVEGAPTTDHVVGLGATREELQRLLGEPTATSVPNPNPAPAMIWKYGDIEYHFGDDGRVWLVYTENSQGTPQVLGQLGRLRTS